MIYFTQAEIEHWLLEDAPYQDATTHALGIAHKPGWLEIRTRETDTVLCGTEEIVRMAKMLDLTVMFSQPSGHRAVRDEIIIKLVGTAGALHKWWRVAVVLLSHASGIATQTRRIVDAITSINPALHIATTRKIPPGNRKMMVKAVLTGVGVIHRLGLSESILVFAQHRVFLEPGTTLSELVNKLRVANPEKLIMLEAESVAEATDATYAGADVVQCGKLPPDTLKDLAPRLKSINPRVIISAAGGITPENATTYASTGIDLLVSSTTYHAPPADFAVTIGAQ